MTIILADTWFRLFRKKKQQKSRFLITHIQTRLARKFSTIIGVFEWLNVAWTVFYVNFSLFFFFSFE